MAAEAADSSVYLYDTLAPLGDPSEEESVVLAVEKDAHTGSQASALENGAVHSSDLSPTTEAPGDRGLNEFHERVDATPAASSDEHKHSLPSNATKTDSDSEALVSETVIETTFVDVLEASSPGGGELENEDFLSLDLKDLDNASFAEQARVSGESLVISATKTSAAKEAPPWARNAGLHGLRFRSPFLQLHQEIVDFCNFVTPTEEEKLVREAAVQRVRDVVKSIWPSCQVKVFGSFATGLFLPTSDCDVVILDSGCQIPLNGLKAIAKALNRKSLVKNLQIIGKARVPIVKFVETDSNIAFDISFDVANGPDAADFIKEVMDALPPLKPLCLVLKIFLQQRELNEVYTGGIGSYALLVMLMAHLQMHPSRRNANSWGDPSPLESNLGILLVDFFDLYGHTLNVRDVGISCRSGGRFYSKASRGFLDPGRPYLLSVEDPQSPDNDIGRNSYNMTKVRSAFLLAHRLLTKLEFDDLPENVGLLGRIVHMDDKLSTRKAILPDLLGSADITGKLSGRGPSGRSALYNTVRSECGDTVAGTSIGRRWLDYEDEDFQRGVGVSTRQTLFGEDNHARETGDGGPRHGRFHDSQHLFKRKSGELENGGLMTGRAKRSRHRKEFGGPSGSSFGAAHYREEGEIGNPGSSAEASTEKLSRKAYEEGMVSERPVEKRNNRWGRRSRALKDRREEGEISLKDDFASIGASIGSPSGEEVAAGGENGHKSRRWFDERRGPKPARLRLEDNAWSPGADGRSSGRFNEERTPIAARTRPTHRGWTPEAGGYRTEGPRKVVTTKVGHTKIAYT